MKHDEKNIFFHELIGLRARVIRAFNKYQEGLEGKIFWETERGILIKRDDGGLARILKHEVLLELELPSGRKIIVGGDYLFGDPIERAKRIKRVKWR